MKLTTCLLVLLLKMSAAYTPEVLDYALRIIEFFEETRFEHAQCIFFDISPHYPFDNILSDVMRSPRLRYVTKVVIQGSYRPSNLSKKPSVLLINPGRAEDLKHFETKVNIMLCVMLFHPATLLLVFLDFTNFFVRKTMRSLLLEARCYNTLYLDTSDSSIYLGSLVSYYKLTNYFPKPHVLMEWLRRELWGSNITYSIPESDPSMNPAFLWMTVTARYLKGDYQQVFKKEGGTDEADIILWSTIALNTMDEFQQVIVNDPVLESVLVPRGEPLNALEVMLMPFQWQVWTLLLMILILAEVVKRLLPALFRNDPILLVVCGFERYNLHQAQRWERIILHSLIILMFFMTSAFETKIISLMIEKPSAPHAKSLEDFDKYGLKFHLNLDDIPHALSHPVIGNYVVHDTVSYPFWILKPGMARYVTQEMAAGIPKLSYNSKRGESFYVELDDKYLVHPVQIYGAAYRSQFLETFVHTYDIIREAGIWNWWHWYYRHALIIMVDKLIPRKKVIRTYLKFDDMLLAWLVLAIGHGIALIVLIGEIVEKRLKDYLRKH